MDLNPTGLKVVLKFFLSKGPNDVTRIISRTMGKLALVSDQYGDMVKNQEIWICEIEKEIGPDKNRGAFLVRPVKLVDPNSLKKLIPGFYKNIASSRTVYLYPTSEPKEPWLLSSNTRKIFNAKYTSIIVPIEFEG